MTTGHVTPYTSLIASEHQNAPKFMATVAASCQPFADILAVLLSIPGLYDLDAAAGAQLDTVGEWVGISRELSEPLTGVYFSLDTAGLGLDQGSLLGPFDPTTGIVALPDDSYRTLVRAKIAANQWDGTVPQAYAIWNLIFSPVGSQILIQDNSNMTMLLALFGSLPNAVTIALFGQGLLDLKPAGVQVVQRYIPTAADTPYFGLDIESAAIAGLDVGAFGIPL